MTALGKIEKIKKNHCKKYRSGPFIGWKIVDAPCKQSFFPEISENEKFLFKAFEVMREIAIKFSDESWLRGDEEEFNKIFEEKMK